MPGIISKGSIESVRSASDIVDLIGSRVRLQRSGNTFKALCPFHKEKSPSFHVNPQRQIFHCFGCGAGGDVFKFTMLNDQVDFVTAVKMLAQRANITLQMEGSSGDDGEAASRERLYSVQEELARFFRRILVEHPSGEPGRQYLKDRQLDGSVAEDFEIGFSPDLPDAVRRWAEQRKIPLSGLQAAGALIANEDGSYYERFRGRLVFPLRDEVGRVCGFSARIIAKDQHPAKYVNSPETLVFKKSRFLFGLHRARKAILEQRTILLCEGQIDVIRCHSAGFLHAAAGLGTALTDDHARMIRRYADTVILLLDADTAGQNAALRSADLFLAAGLVVRVVSLPDGEDPDSLILRNGAEALKARIESAVSALDYRITVMSERETKDEAGQLRVVRAALDSIALAPSAAQQEQMARMAANRLGLSHETLMSDLRRRQQRPVRAAAEERRSRPETESPAAPADEVELARLLYHHPEVAELMAHHLPLSFITHPDTRVLIAALMRGCTNPVTELADAGPGIVRLASEIMVSETRVRGDDVSSEQACGDLMVRLHRRALDSKRATLDEQRRTATGSAREMVDLELKQVIMDQHTLRRGWPHARSLMELSQ